nr:DUF3467 domain-containing protein [Microbacterium hominis]
MCRARPTGSPASARSRGSSARTARRLAGRRPCRRAAPAPRPAHREKEDGMNDETPRQFEIDLPPEIVAGTYADFANVWHTPDVFVMDFVCLARPPQAGVDAEGAPVTVVPGRVVQRVRIPPQQVFELAKALTQQLEFWEQETGRRSEA